MKIYKSTFFLFLAIARHPASTTTATADEEGGFGGANKKKIIEQQPHRRTSTTRTKTDNIDPATQFNDVSLSWIEATYLLLASF